MAEKKSIVWWLEIIRIIIAAITGAISSVML